MASTKITVLSNGSLKVEGDFEIQIKKEIYMILAEEKLFPFAAVVSPTINLFVMALTKGILSMMLKPFRFLLKSRYSNS